MTSHHRRVLVAISAALCLALSASTGALAAAGGDTKVDYPGAAASSGAPATPGGDTKLDYPGTGEPPAGYVGTHYPVTSQYDAQPTVTVNGHQPPIVRDADALVPTMLASVALLLALAALATTLARTRMQPRPGRSL
jgi:hypothetical protein